MALAAVNSQPLDCEQFANSQTVDCEDFGKQSCGWLSTTADAILEATLGPPHVFFSFFSRFFFFFFLFWIHLLLLCPCNFCSTFFCRFSLHFPLHFAAFLFFLCLMTMIIINIHFFCKLFLGLFFLLRGSRYSLLDFFIIYWSGVVSCALQCVCLFLVQRASNERTKKKQEKNTKEKRSKPKPKSLFLSFFFLLHSKFKISTS